MTRSKDKGTAWETATVTTLRRHGAPHAERRALHGAADRGDVAGVPGVVIEDKAERTLDLAGWTAELLAEMTNAAATIGAVWAKRVGRTDPLDGYVILPPIVWLRLLAQAGYTDPEHEWTANADDLTRTQATRAAMLINLADAYHYATSNDCTSDDCPGALYCSLGAPSPSLDGLGAVADALEQGDEQTTELDKRKAAA